MTPRPFPPVLPHGELREVFPDVFFVTGTIALPGPLPVKFSRNMTVLRDGERLVIVNSVRLDEAGLRSLDALGKVTDVIRLAGFHGADDPFYADRYGAKVWALEGQRYTAGFDAKAADTYFEPHGWLGKDSPLPVPRASLYVFSTRPSEALLLLERDGGILIAGDCLQNWAKADAYFNTPARLVMRMMGFLKPYNVGPGWVRAAKPDGKELRGLLDLTFANVLPAHGEPVLGDARAQYRAAIERVASR